MVAVLGSGGCWILDLRRVASVPLFASLIVSRRDAHVAYRAKNFFPSGVSLCNSQRERSYNAHINGAAIHRADWIRVLSGWP